MNFNSLLQLTDHFKDEKTCIKYYEKLRWNGKPICPHCGADAPYKTNRGYKCSNSECYKKFTVKVGTIFENSKIPFRIWFGAIFLCTAHKKGISSVQLATDLNITQKTAWFVLHRIREMLKEKSPNLIGSNNMVEGDETYVGGIEINRHKSKRLASPATGLANDGTPYNNKKIILGVIERQGKVILKHVPNATENQMLPFIKSSVVQGSRIITDEFTGYSKVGKNYNHNTINHKEKIYVIGDVHTNTIENFWSVLKRGIYGTYHQVSSKHIDRYLNEFAGRFNTRKSTSQDRFELVLTKAEGRLLYKNLIAKD